MNGSPRVGNEPFMPYVLLRSLINQSEEHSCVRRLGDDRRRLSKGARHIRPHYRRAQAGGALQLHIGAGSPIERQTGGGVGANRNTAKAGRNSDITCDLEIIHVVAARCGEVEDQTDAGNIATQIRARRIADGGAGAAQGETVPVGGRGSEGLRHRQVCGRSRAGVQRQRRGGDVPGTGIDLHGHARREVGRAGSRGDAGGEGQVGCVCNANDGKGQTGDSIVGRRGGVKGRDAGRSFIGVKRARAGGDLENAIGRIRGGQRPADRAHRIIVDQRADEREGFVVQEVRWRGIHRKDCGEVIGAGIGADAVAGKEGIRTRVRAVDVQEGQDIAVRPAHAGAVGQGDVVKLPVVSQWLAA